MILFIILALNGPRSQDAKAHIVVVTYGHQCHCDSQHSLCRAQLQSPTPEYL